MRFLETCLSWGCFFLVALIVAVAPWLFGAWEVWWFWPFVVCIFLSTGLFGLLLLNRAIMRWVGRPEAAEARNCIETVSEIDVVNTWMKALAVLSFLPFLVYAFIRLLHAEVFMDAQRSFLLFLTPFLLGIQIVFGLREKQAKTLYWLVAVNLLALGLYGIANHLIDHSRHVLWAEGYAGYISENRATGSYFCPDHFSGIMELAFGLGLGALLARETGRWWKLSGGVLALVALYAIVLSKSRGGGLTVVVILAAALCWGFSQWPVAIRWYLRLSLLAVGALGLTAFCCIASGYVTRFMSGQGRELAKAKTAQVRLAVIEDLVRTSSRGRMYAGALRAWNTERFFGVGPGMHQDLWPHFAASPDGDRDKGVWPSLPNNTFHSYEVHSDWLQLLEEYGILGVLLFLLPVIAVFTVLMIGVGRERRDWRSSGWRDVGGGYHPLLLGGIFAFVALAFHSLGDFNLQMPATVWLLAALIAIPIACITRDERA
jgi:O-antigen ligase